MSGLNKKKRVNKVRDIDNGVLKVKRDEMKDIVEMMANDIRDAVFTHLRRLDLQARLMILASCNKGVVFQTEDIQCTGLFLLDVTERLERVLKERINMQMKSVMLAFDKTEEEEAK